MKLSMRFLILISMAFFASQAWADKTKAYVDESVVTPTSIPAPPEVGSTEWKNEIEQIVEMQKTLAADVVKKANDERDMKPELMTLAVDSGLNRNTHPALYRLLDRLEVTSKTITGAAKNHWNTKRPYLMDKRIKTPIKTHDNPAYPSGHTSGSYLWASVLSELMPEKKDTFMNRAEEIAQHRVFVGMHFPHDVEGGKLIAANMYKALQTNADFNHDLASAKTELAKATAKKPQ